jgi:hypothetical protein
MNILKRFLLGILLLSSLFVQANAYMFPNSLPAPAWIQAVEITESKIKIEWAPVSGAVMYKVSRFDVTNNVQLPDEFVVEEEFTSQPHNPGTTIQFDVAAIDENDEEGAAASAEYTTGIIIVDDIASFNVPAPGGNYYIQPNGINEVSLNNADKTEETVTVMRVKISFSSHFAEFLVWSQCVNSNAPWVYVQYYQPSNWPASVSAHLVNPGENNNGQTPCEYIQFRINQSQDFFRLHMPSYVHEFDLSKLVIKNDLKNSQILFQRSTDAEINSCFVPQGGYQVQDIPETFDGNADLDGSEDAAQTAALSQPQAAQALTVSPNPFHDALKVDYLVAQSGAVQLVLTDLTGKTMQHINFNHLASGNYTAYLSTNTLPAGMYLLTVQSEAGRTSVPVAKH